MTVNLFPLQTEAVQGPGRRVRVGAVLACGYAVAIAGVFAVAPGRVPELLIAGPVAAVIVIAGVRSPIVATGLLLVTSFLRLALPNVLFDPFVFAFAGVLASAGVWAAARGRNLPAIGLLEFVMLTYVLWNLASMIAPHQYPATTPVSPDTNFSVSRYIFSGTVMPFAMFLVGRRILVRPGHLRAVLWIVLGAAAYSALVSILQFHGPRSWVWPQYIVTAPNWTGRAVGVFNQPVVNGLVLILGFVIGVMLTQDPRMHTTERWIAGLVCAACAYGVYLTHTRAVWLAFAVIVILGSVFVARMRRGFLITAAVMVSAVAINWSTFLSSDRKAGGVGSPDEIEDRLNTIATSTWAVGQKPWFGWGVGRFAAVNTYHHQQFSPSVPWSRGYGIPSHLNDLGILAELGVFGLAMWLTVVVLIATLLVRAWRVSRGAELYQHRLMVIAAFAFVSQIIIGLTVDLRYFVFPSIVVFLLAGLAIGVADRLRSGCTANRQRGCPSVEAVR
ncbi:O-antigen ligase family protein [Tomitella gaofuii]|uniref:O-antigen ligase family protein n=1 Tax=Tomitella gaofuii TaxID=2760083 RepID=UPI0015F9E426|nr:O-antigen ligase family protein [Tomitella gaofuii]